MEEKIEDQIACVWQNQHLNPGQPDSSHPLLPYLHHAIDLQSHGTPIFGIALPKGTTNNFTAKFIHMSHMY